MLKKTMVMIMLLAGISCAAMVVNTTLPLDVEKKVASGELKKGESYAGVYLWLISYGDASIKAAAENGGITNILYVDQREAAFSFFGTVYKRTTVIYGY
ncbi:MAG: TRL-like family protein [Candidatus Margulisbacteria bacterium]|jgi:hypothetical protein|nr:TRL-like family protein [Candidatus Margulisiibacteriota bacterium]